jgi:hypothetical protein
LSDLGENPNFPHSFKLSLPTSFGDIMGNGTKANGIEITHEMPSLELGRPAYQTSPQEADYRTEIKKVGQLTLEELNRCMELGKMNFEYEPGLEGFIRRYYFSDASRDMILTYQENNIVAFHEATIIDLGDAKVIDHSFSVVDKEHRRRGIDGRANKARHRWCIGQDCTYASFKTRSPYMAERRMEDGFQNPLLTNERSLVPIGLRIGEAREEDIDTDLIVSKTDPDGLRYYSKAKTKPAKKSRTNTIFGSLEPYQRLRLIRKL